jgi:hypothetical protein
LERIKRRAILNDMRDNIERRISPPWNKVPPPEGWATMKNPAEQIVKTAIWAYRMHPHDFDLEVVVRNAEANSLRALKCSTMECPNRGCGRTLLFTTTEKNELLRLAESGDLTAMCPVHDRIILTPEQQMEIAKNWHEPPSGEN